MPRKKEPFVSGEDRPVAKIDLDTPIAQLRVRDLQSIIQGRWGKLIHPKFEVKTEIKEFFDKNFPEKGWVEVTPGPGAMPPDLSQLIETTAALSEKVDRLSDKLAALEKKTRE